MLYSSLLLHQCWLNGLKPYRPNDNYGSAVNKCFVYKMYTNILWILRGFLKDLWASIKIILILQNTALIIIMFQKKERESRKEIFHSYTILTRPSVYIFVSYLFLKQN